MVVSSNGNHPLLRSTRFVTSPYQRFWFSVLHFRRVYLLRSLLNAHTQTHTQIHIYTPSHPSHTIRATRNIHQTPRTPSNGVAKTRNVNCQHSSAAEEHTKKRWSYIPLSCEQVFLLAFKSADKTIDLKSLASRKQNTQITLEVVYYLNAGKLKVLDEVKYIYRRKFPR